MKNKTKQDWKGIEPENWTQYDCMACLVCKTPLLVNDDNRLAACFNYKCKRYGLYTALSQKL